MTIKIVICQTREREVENVNDDAKKWATKMYSYFIDDLDFFELILDLENGEIKRFLKKEKVFQIKNFPRDDNKVDRFFKTCRVTLKILVGVFSVYLSSELFSMNT